MPQNDHFGLIWDYRKMPKVLVSSIEGHKDDPLTRTDQSKPKSLVFGDYGLR